MKSFYEMLKILEGTNYDAWLASGYDDSVEPSFERFLGEGDLDSPFVVKVYVDEGAWTATGPIWVLGYVLNGSENPASEPVAYEDGEGYNGTKFMKPGKRLELLPLSIRADAIKWVDKEVERAIQDHLDGHDDYGYDDDREEPYNPDSQP